MIDFEYELRRTSRKSVSVQITKEAKIIVRAPFDLEEQYIEAFLEEKRAWIEKHVILMKEKYATPFRKLTDEEKMEIRVYAENILSSRVSYYAKHMEVEYNSIKVKFQKTVFGSCSSKNNLNFNAIIVYMPTDVMDYVIVHELAHLKQMNHSAAFWKEVESILPNYKIARKWLKANGARYIQLI